MPIVKKQDMNRREGSSPGLEICEIVDMAQGTQSLKVGEVPPLVDLQALAELFQEPEEAAP